MGYSIFDVCFRTSSQLASCCDFVDEVLSTMSVSVILFYASPPKTQEKWVSLYFSPSFSSLAVCHGEHRSYSEGLDNEHTRSHSNIVFNWRQPATSSLYAVPICCVWQCACVCFQIFPWAWDYFDWQVQSLVTTILVFTDVTRICRVGIAIATASGIVSPWFQRDAMFRHLMLLFCQSVSQSESIGDAC